MTDAVEFFAKVEERLDPPPTLSREEAVLLAVLDPLPFPGRCCACGDDISDKSGQARWCDECMTIRLLLAAQGSLYRWRAGTKRQDRCKDCGELYPTRRGPGVRCPACQPIHTQEIKNRFDREMRRKKREAIA